MPRGDNAINLGLAEVTCAATTPHHRKINNTRGRTASIVPHKGTDGLIGSPSLQLPRSLCLDPRLPRKCSTGLPSRPLSSCPPRSSTPSTRFSPPGRNVTRLGPPVCPFSGITSNSARVIGTRSLRNGEASMVRLVLSSALSRSHFLFLVSDRRYCLCVRPRVVGVYHQLVPDGRGDAREGRRVCGPAV
jgi:hypothetical protein